MTSAIMPDLVRRGASYRHTLASAMESLLALGVSASNISFRYEAVGGPPDMVTNQEPPPGTSLEDSPRILITISGFGVYHGLPFGYRVDAADEDVISTSHLMGLFDSEMIRFRYWRDHAPQFFGIGPNWHAANERWLRLFGLDPGLWPRERHFTLCTLVPGLHRIAGTEAGVRLVLKKLLGVELAEIRYRRAFCEIAEETRNSMNRVTDPAAAGGEGVREMRNLILGVNAVLGRQIEKARRCELRIGPVTLHNWRELTSESGMERTKQALRLCMPLGLKYTYSFVVGDPSRAPELGNAERNSVLGMNMHLGGRRWPAEEKKIA